MSQNEQPPASIQHQAIVAEGLTRAFGERIAVDHMSFEVGQGDVSGFLGPNGAGKSTTARMLTGFLSGVFIPHADMPRWGQWLSPFSLLPYCADLVRIGFGDKAYWSVGVDVMALGGFMLAFVVLVAYLHHKTRDKFR